MASVLKAAGHTHTYDWTVHGSVQGEGEDRIREVSVNETQGVLDADVVIVLLPGGRGTHSELGIAIASDSIKAILICAEDDSLFLHDDRTCAFYWHPRVERVVGAMDDWLARILAVGYSIDFPYGR